MPPKCLGSLSQIWGCKKTQNFDHFFRDFHSRHRIFPEWNVASTNKNASVNLQCVPQKLTYFPWPLTQKRLRYFAHCDPPFGGHYVATIIVATCCYLSYTSCATVETTSSVVLGLGLWLFLKTKIQSLILSLAWRFSFCLGMCAVSPTWRPILCSAF